MGHGDFEQYKKVKLIKYFVERDEKIRHISVGYKHVVALSMKNKIFCWGSNCENQCGSRYKLNYPYPK